MNDIIRRKLSRAASAGGDSGGPGADQGWRLAFARAARDRAGLMVDVLSMKVHRRSLAELLEIPPDRAFLALLDGPQGGLGLLVMSAEVMSAVIEMQTTGRVSATAPLHRKPTRTDAAMVSGTIDRALEELEAILAEEADLVWAGGFRYASFLEDPRPMGLLLEDQPYRVLTAELGLSGDARKGQMILALPAEGRGMRPSLLVGRAKEMPAAGFAADLGTAVMAADCALEAVLDRLTLPLRDVMALQPGQVLELPKAALDQITLEGLDGRTVAQARLGQHKGMRALRLKDGTLGSSAAGPSPETALTTPFPMNDPMPMPADIGLPMAFDQPLQADDPMAGFGMPLDLDGGLLAAG